MTYLVHKKAYFVIHYSHSVERDPPPADGANMHDIFVCQRLIRTAAHSSYERTSGESTDGTRYLVPPDISTGKHNPDSSMRRGLIESEPLCIIDDELTEKTQDYLVSTPGFDAASPTGITASNPVSVLDGCSQACMCRDESIAT